MSLEYVYNKLKEEKKQSNTNKTMSWTLNSRRYWAGHERGLARAIKLIEENLQVV